MKGCQSFLFGVVLTLASCAAPAAQAKPPAAEVAAVPTVRLEVVDQQDGRARHVRFVLPVAETGASELTATVAGARYRLRLMRVGEGADAPLRFEIERSALSGRRDRSIQVEVTVRMRRGVRVRLTRLDAGRDAGTEVFAQLS